MLSLIIVHDVGSDGNSLCHLTFIKDFNRAIFNLFSLILYCKLVNVNEFLSYFFLNLGNPFFFLYESLIALSKCRKVCCKLVDGTDFNHSYPSIFLHSVNIELISLKKWNFLEWL